MAATVKWAVTAGVGAALLAGLTTAPAQAAPRIKLSSDSVPQGRKLKVKVNTGTFVERCMMRVRGTERFIVGDRPVNGGVARASFTTASMKVGSYRLVVKCAGRTSQARFKVVKPSPAPPRPTPPGPAPVPPIPTQATCTVASFGSSQFNGFLTGGAEVRNTSGTSDAINVSVTFDFQRNGVSVLSQTVTMPTIPPSRSAVLGVGNLVVPTGTGTIQMRVLAPTCESQPHATTGITNLATGTGTATPDPLGGLALGGSFVNSYSFNLAASALIYYVTRDSSGNITGGGYTTPNPATITPPTGPVSWSTFNRALEGTSRAATVQTNAQPVAVT